MPHTYQYPRAALTVDCVVFGLDEEDLKVALVQRGLEPNLVNFLPQVAVQVPPAADAEYCSATIAPTSIQN